MYVFLQSATTSGDETGCNSTDGGSTPADHSNKNQARQIRSTSLTVADAQTAKRVGKKKVCAFVCERERAMCL